MNPWIARPLVACALTAAAASAGPQAPGPSFDCAKASSQVEQLVCKDEGLTALDRRLAEVYAAATKSWPENVAAEQRAYQRGWIKGRDECWKDTDVRACTERSYETRIVELQIRSGQLQAPTPVGYACSGGEGKPFLVTYYQETDPKSAVITYGDDQVIALAAPTGSGARYTAAGVELWEHQGEAAVEWFGTKLTCRPRKGGPVAQGGRQERRPLAGTSWLLVEFQSMDDTTLRPEGGARYALKFVGAQLQLQSDCNRGMASWSSPDDVTLEIGPVALTRAMCPPSPLQERFVRDLGFVRSYVVRDGRLHLSLMADGGIYSFEPDPEG